MKRAWKAVLLLKERNREAVKAFPKINEIEDETPKDVLVALLRMKDKAWGEIKWVRICRGRPTIGS